MKEMEDTRDSTGGIMRENYNLSYVGRRTAPGKETFTPRETLGRIKTSAGNEAKA